MSRPVTSGWPESCILLPHNHGICFRWRASCVRLSRLSAYQMLVAILIIYMVPRQRRVLKGPVSIQGPYRTFGYMALSVLSLFLASSRIHVGSLLPIVDEWPHG